MLDEGFYRECRKVFFLEPVYCMWSFYSVDWSDQISKASSLWC